MDLGLVDLRVTEVFLGEVERAAKEVLETGTSKGSVEVDGLEQGVDLDGSLRRRRESVLGPLASRAETTESTRAGREICGRYVSTSSRRR